MRRHARLLDYPFHDGCNARVWIAFEVETGGDGLVLPGCDPDTGIGGTQIEHGLDINGEVQAEGRDIYGQNLVVRHIWILQADVLPGNSGGPLVDLDGNVLGVIFAASTGQQGTAYALTDTEVQPDIDKAQGRTEAVQVGPCAM